MENTTLCSALDVLIYWAKRNFIQFDFHKVLYMFRTDLLSIIRSLNTVYTAIGIYHANYVGCLLARSGRTLSLSETCRFLYENKLEKECISLVFIIRMYHDTRTSECQIRYFIIKLTER